MRKHIATVGQTATNLLSAREALPFPFEPYRPESIAAATGIQTRRFSVSIVVYFAKFTA